MTDEGKTIAIPKKYVFALVFVIVILITAVVAIVSYYLGSQNYQPITAQFVATEKQSCPFECCIEGEYHVKACETDYDCQNNKCVAIDSDKDGLTDIQEKQFGSNPFIFDTDADGLNDYAEKQKGTDPNNANTDSDRYDDKIDPDPLTKNSAVVNAQISNEEWNWDIFGVLSLLNGNFNVKVATVKADVSIQNTGNDYTEYVKFDIAFRLVNSEVKRVSESVGRLNVGDTQNKHYEYELRVSDVPNTLLNAVTQKSTSWDVQIQNVMYEEFQ